MTEPVEDVLDISGAVAAGLDLLVTIVCKPDWQAGQIGYARFVISRFTLADPAAFAAALRVELEIAADDVRRYLDGEGYKIGPKSLWRAWGSFHYPHDLAMEQVAVWDGDL